MITLANSLDYSSLHTPMHTTDIDALLHPNNPTAAQRAKSRRVLHRRASLGIILLGALGIVLGIILPNASQLLGASVWILIGGVTYKIGLTVTLRQQKRAARMTRFAKQNNIIYTYNTVDQQQTGMIFDIGNGRTHTDTLRFSTGTEIGNYHYTTGSGKSRRTHWWTYARITLPRQLPHMVLDAKKNNFWLTLTNLPTGFSRSQTLSLEGNFDTYFTLYAPATYKTDALYILTPDVMAALIDYGQNYDIEIIDNVLYIYAQGMIALDTSTNLEPLLAITDVISREVGTQGQRYRDDRRTDQSTYTIADPGRRLRTRPPTTVVLTLIAIVIWIIVTAIT